MKRFALASVIALTLTAGSTALADEPAAAPAPNAEVAPAAPAADKPAPVVTAAAPIAPPPAPTHTAVIAAPAPTVAPTTAQPAKPAAAAPAPAAPPAATTEQAPAPTPAPTPAPSATPLHVAQITSPSQPLQLAPQPEGLGWGYKLLAVAAIGGAVALYLKKKKGLTLPGAIVPSKIDILGKSGVGVRSQLVVVEVEGTRLLIGMTPTSISTLAVLQTPDDDVQPASSRAPTLTTASALASLTERADRAEQDAFRPATLNDRVRSLLGADEPVMPRLTAVSNTKPSSPKPRARTTRAPSRPKAGSSDSREIAGQARGLLLSDDEDA